MRIPASPIPHDFGDRGFHDRIDERDNDNDVSDQNLGDKEERGHAKTTSKQYSSGRPSSTCEDAHRHVAGDSIETKSRARKHKDADFRLARTAPMITKHRKPCGPRKPRKDVFRRLIRR